MSDYRNTNGKIKGDDDEKDHEGRWLVSYRFRNLSLPFGFPDPVTCGNRNWYVSGTKPDDYDDHSDWVLRFFSVYGMGSHGSWAERILLYREGEKFMKEKISQLATIFSAFVMAGCCLGPIILIPLGLTGIAGSLAIFATKYQVFLIIVTVVLLCFSFYLVYGRKCRKKSAKIGLWFTTAWVFGMLFYTLKAKGYL